MISRHQTHIFLRWLLPTHIVGNWWQSCSDTIGITSCVHNVASASDIKVAPTALFGSWWHEGRPNCNRRHLPVISVCKYSGQISNRKEYNISMARIKMAESQNGAIHICTTRWRHKKETPFLSLAWPSLLNEQWSWFEVSWCSYDFSVVRSCY